MGIVERVAERGRDQHGGGDAWADAHRIPVEEEKPTAERGLYLHPTEHGQPAAKGIDAVRNAAMKPAGHK